MGFQLTEWAYGLQLPGTEKAVMQALAHRADDTTGVTFVGRKTLASMIGMTDRSVSNGLASLEEKGLIGRTQRRRKDGYRDTDEIKIDVTWTGSQVNQLHVNEFQVNEDQVNVMQTSCESNDDLTCTTFQASSKELVIHGHTGVIHTLFDDFWSAWPRKVKKPNALRAWEKAIKRARPEQIVAAAIAYRDNPGRPDLRYIPHPATWLNADSWNDELEDSRERSGKLTPTERAQATLQAGLNVAQRRQTFGNVTTLNPKGITA